MPVHQYMSSFLIVTIILRYLLKYIWSAISCVFCILSSEFMGFSWGLVR